MTEPVLLINPRRRRRRKNARHRSRRRRHANPRHFRMRRRRRRNPRGLGGIGRALSPMTIVRGTVIPAAIGGAGAVALDVALANIPGIPDTLKTGLPATLVKLIGAIGLGWLAGMAIGRERGRLITLGAVTVMGYQFIRDQGKAMFPTVKGFGSYTDYVDYTLMQDRGGMGAYMTPSLASPARLNGLGFISPAPVVQGGGVPLGAYMSPDLAPGFAGFNYESPDGM